MGILSTESFLLRPGLPVDPFNRLGTPITPAITVIEFCQFIGPKCMVTASLIDENRALDVDSVALWLMSSETPSGTVVMMFNQQMAVYALAYYFTLYDFQARAFQRPLCFAYLSCEKPDLDTLERFRASVRKLTLPLLVCNRRFFVSSIRDVIELSDSLEEDGNLAEELGTTYSKLKPLCDQAARLRTQLTGLEDQLSFFDSVATDCGGHYSSDKDLAYKHILQFKAGHSLKPVKEIIPCVFDEFTQSLKPLLQSLEKKSHRMGVLYSSGIPVLRHPKYETPTKENHFSGTTASTSEQSLRTITEHVDNVIFQILSGEDLWVTGSSSRKSTVVGLTTKFNQIRPRSHFNHENQSWIDSNKKSIPQGIVGLHSQLLKDGQKREEPSAVLDVTTSKLRLAPYSGVLLSALRARRRFPSDIAYVMFVASLISKICFLVYMSRYVPTNKLKEENLSHDDLCIILNLLTEVDLIKFQKLRSAYLKQRVSTTKTMKF